MNWIVNIRPADFGQIGFNLLIYRRGAMGKTEILRGDGVVETLEPGAYAAKPTLFLDQDMMRPLMDALVEMNIKPTDAGKTEGLLEAQSEHLADLRFLLKLPPPIITITEKRQ